MNFPITLDAIRDYENELASQIEEHIYQTIKPHMETSVTKIAEMLVDQIKINVRGRQGDKEYSVFLGHYASALAKFTVEDTRTTIRRRFTDEMIRTSFPGAEVVFDDYSHCCVLKWTVRV
jgi:predicted small metal-binding protein